MLARQEHIDRAVVVTGSDGLDEVTLDGPTHAWIVEAGTVKHEVWQPEDFGLRQALGDGDQDPRRGGKRTEAQGGVRG